MTKVTFLTAAVAALALSACVPNPPPIVTGYNEASVEIQQTQFASVSRADDPMVVAEAQRICATAGRRAEYASTRVNTHDSVATHLFLCLAT